MSSEKQPGEPKDVWVFGYGSLMWQPGFRFAERVRARLAGYHRCFCIYSVYYRGSPKRPGLVLGLDKGGSCDGVAYRVAAPDADEVFRYLRKREQVTGAYREKIVQIELLTAERPSVPALTYLAERAHPSYAGLLPLRRQAVLIRGARGLTGTNLEYFVNTRLHLVELGIRDAELARLATTLGGLVSARASMDGACPRANSISAAARRLPVSVQKLRPDQRKRFRYRLMLGTQRRNRGDG